MKPPKSHKRSHVKFLLLISGLALIFFIINRFGVAMFLTTSEEKIGGVSQIPPQPKEKTSLETDITSILSQTQGSYGVVIKHLKTGQTYSFNPDEEFETGSLYKLWTMATAFKQIQDGSLDEDAILSEDVSVLNREQGLASEEGELAEGTITLTVRSALEQMITISHNYAAQLLTDKVTPAKIAQILNQNDLQKSQLATPTSAPTSSASDIALFYEKLYSGKLANAQYSTQMLDLLKRQKLNNKLPKYLPGDTVVAHKTGEIGLLSHDAGIVYAPSGEYIIVVFSKTDYPPGAEEVIAKISKAAFDYFSPTP